MGNSARVVHAKVSGKAQGPDATRIYGNHWDADHTVTGLENVDNTADADKPVSTAQAAALALKAPLASPTFTGTPAAPTAAVDTNTTQIATTAMVLAQAASATPLIDGVAAVGTSTRFARADHIHPTDTTRAALASPTFTGTPAAPTAAVDTNTTQLATTAFVLAQAASATPLVDGSATVGTSTRFARADHIHPTDTTLAPLASPTFTGTPAAPTATVGTNTTQLATTAFVLANAASAGVTSFNTLTGAITFPSLENRIINPSGIIQQAGLASSADVAYTGFDQWYALTQSNPITPSALTAVENSTPFMMRFTQANVSAQRFGVAQAIENKDCIDLRGKSVVLSARVRMSASTTLRYAIVEWTGTADTITKDIVLDWTNGTFTAGQFFTSTSTTITGTGSIALTANTLADITVLTGTIGSSANNIVVFFWTNSTQAQNVTLDIAKVKLETGTVSTSFVPRQLAAEIVACQRFYEKSYDLATAPATVTNNGTIGQRSPFASSTSTPEFAVQFTTRKRTSGATITLYSPTTGATGNFRNNSTSADGTAAVQFQGESAFLMFYSGTCSTADLLFGHWVADNRL